MNHKTNNETPKSVKSVWPAVFIMCLSAATLFAARNYSEISSNFPNMVAATLFVLGAFDFYSRTNLPGQKMVSIFWGSGFDRREMQHVPSFSREAIIVAWVAFMFFGMSFFGILIAAPAFVFLFVWLRSGWAPLKAFMIAAMVFAFEFGVFEWALDYTLYRGLLFNGEGFSNW